MNYTLDSVEHAKEVLKETLKIKNVTAIPVVLDLEQLTKKELNNYYFGVITIGSNIEKLNLSLFGLNFIDVEKNSQIIELFDFLTITKVVNDLNYSKGHFRGFRLITDSSTFEAPQYD